jgi:hypothetical protein
VVDAKCFFFFFLHIFKIINPRVLHGFMLVRTQNFLLFETIIISLFLGDFNVLVPLNLNCNTIQNVFFLCLRAHEPY